MIMKLMVAIVGMLIAICSYGDPLPNGGPYNENINGVEWTFWMWDRQAFLWLHISDEFLPVIPVETEGGIVVPSVLGEGPVQKLGDRAFAGCGGLTSVSIPEGIWSIDHEVFFGCSNLISVTIPQTVTFIGDRAFSKCEKIRSMKIPEGVKSIGEGAFDQCYLKIIEFEGAPPSGLATANIGQEAEIRYNAVYKDEWLPVIEECGFKNATAYLPDGGPYIEAVEGVEWVFVVRGGEICLGNENRDEGPAIVDFKGGAVVVPSEIFGMKVTSILNGAFYEFSDMTSITIPEGVKSIDGGAFQGCSGLTSIVVDEKNDSFKSVDGVLFTMSMTDLVICPRNKSGSYSISEGVTTIRKYAFQDCSGLTSVAIPGTVTSVKREAFAGCSGLGEGVVIRDGWVIAVNGTCPSEVAIPEGIVGIGDGVFMEHSELKSITIPEGVIEIGEGTFAGCSNLQTITIPEGITRIGDCAFEFCERLSSVVLPSTVVDIGKGGFNCCLALKSLTIPTNVKNISDYAFSCCEELTDITIPASVTNIGEYAFHVCGMTNVTILSSTVHIGFCAFYGGGASLRVTFPEGLTQIDNCSFYCSAVTDVVIPSTVTNIGGAAFCNSRLGSVRIPDGVTSIGKAAFKQCSSLSNVTIAASVTDIGEYAFEVWRDSILVEFEGAPPAGLSSAGFNHDAAIRYNVAYEKEWLPVIEECGFTNATPYEPDPKPVTFVAVNGEVSRAALFYTSDVYGVLPEARRDGFAFAGWYTSLDGTNRVRAFSPVDPKGKTWYARWVENDVSLYAQWAANRYTVSFNANGGEGEMAAQPFLYDQVQCLNGARFTKTGYSFKGWSTSAGGEVVYKDGESVSNLTAEAGFAVALFAKWEKVIDVLPEEVEEWVGYMLAPKFKKAGETNSQYRKRFEATYGDDYSAAFFEETGKIGQDGTHLQVWHDYVAGTDPLDENDKFTAIITIEDGVVKVEYSPKFTDQVEIDKRVYKTWGKVKLQDADWVEVPDGHNADYNFFKVTVEMK